MFYRAGYIESWGRGIQKICDACKTFGADEPEYIVQGEDIMVKFNALQSVKTSKHQSTKIQGALVQRIVEALGLKLEISQDEIAEELGLQSV